MTGIGLATGDQGGRAAVLVRYRVFGGPVAVDQRLTVFEDGAVQLDERHRSRDPIWLRVDGADLERLRSLLDSLPAQRWSGRIRLAMTRVRRVFFLSPTDLVSSGTQFHLRRGRRAVVSGAVEDPDIAAAVELLDALRGRAVRSLPR